MSATLSPSNNGGAAGTLATDQLTNGQAEVDKLIGEMDAAFLFATETNLKITVNKTIDGSEETVAQQRPNVG